MGRDKAELELGGVRLVDHALASLERVASRILVASGETQRFREFELECVLDPVKDGGPLAGLVAGLEAARSRWLAVVACDMPRVDSEVLLRLVDRARREGLDAALFATRAGPEPLCAVYSTACLASAREALESGERRMNSFHGGRDGLRKLDVRAFTAHELGLPELGDDPAANLNTPEDLARERARANTERQSA